MSVREYIAKNPLFIEKGRISAKESASKLGVNNTGVSNRESGNDSIDTDALFTACEILGITLNDMYDKYSFETDEYALPADEA